MRETSAGFLKFCKYRIKFNITIERKSFHLSLRAMAAWSPTREGFRAIWRQPALSLAEVAWRWSFGAAAGVLLSVGLLEYLDSLPVAGADALLLRTRQPFLVFRTLAHVVQGSGLRLVVAGLFALTALSVLWILLASIGRTATLAVLIEYVRSRARKFGSEEDETIDVRPESPGSFGCLRSVAGLSLLRASVTLAAYCAGVATVILAGFATPIGWAVLVLALMSVLIWVTWSSLNWFLSIASIFVVRSGADTFGSLARTVDFLRNRFLSLLAVGAWFGVAHLTLFLCALWSVLLVSAVMGAASPIFALASVFLAILLYFSLVDALYVGRLAAYLAIADAPHSRSAPYVTSPEPPLLIEIGSGRVDQGETILSDKVLSSLPAGNL
jgi:hypothetical protein